jgi:hypothetical protein
MNTTTTAQNMARRAAKIYEERLKEQLEPSHREEFVAIEPDSGDYFLGRTLSEALGRARQVHPGRLAHVLRVGHKSAIHFGASLS